MILKISGRPLTALTIGGSSRVREGETYAFPAFRSNGFRSECGDAQSQDLSGNASCNATALRPATGQKVLIRLTAPYDVFQLDATAYPGNSGSPLYQLDSGQVVGIINKEFIQETKSVLSSELWHSDRRRNIG